MQKLKISTIEKESAGESPFYRTTKKLELKCKMKVKRKDEVSDMKNSKKLGNIIVTIFIVLGLSMLALLIINHPNIVVPKSENLKRIEAEANAIEETRQHAIALCEEKGLENIDVEVVKKDKYEGHNVYYIIINATKEKYGIKSVEIFRLNKELENTKVPLELSLTLHELYINDDKYYNGIDGDKLYRNGNIIYQVRSQYTSSSAAKPYEGMSEASINFTDLGKADKVEPCKDFSKMRAERRYKKYKWYDNKGRVIFTATTSYSKNGRAVEGYVSSVSEITYDDKAIQQAKKDLSKQKKEEKSKDPYNAKDYKFAEDFYEDHYDDFFDYYDAEDYFNEHHD